MEKITNIIDEGLNINKEENKIPMEQIGFFNNGEDFKIFLNKDEKDENVLYLEYKDTKTGGTKEIKLLNKNGVTEFDKLYIGGKDIETTLKKAEEFYNIIKNAKWSKKFDIEDKIAFFILPFSDSEYTIEMTDFDSTIESVTLTYYNGDNKAEVDENGVKMEDTLDSAITRVTRTLKNNLISVSLKGSAGKVVITAKINLE